MNDTVNILLSQNEIQALFQLIDISVKSQGLNVAETAVVLSKKIEEAVKQSKNYNSPTSDSLEFTVMNPQPRNF